MTAVDRNGWVSMKVHDLGPVRHICYGGETHVVLVGPLHVSWGPHRSWRGADVPEVFLTFSERYLRRRRWVLITRKNKIVVGERVDR